MLKIFIKPNKLKLTITIILLLVTFPILPKSSSCQATRYGFPLEFFQFSECVNIGPCIETTEPGPHIICEPMGIIPYEGVIAFILDIIFWYLVSCILVYAYYKINGKRKT